MYTRSALWTAVIGTAVTMCTSAILLATTHGRAFLERPTGPVLLVLWVLWTFIIVSNWPVQLRLFQKPNDYLIAGGLGLVSTALMIAAVPWEYTHFQGPIPRDSFLSWVGIVIFAVGDLLQLITLATLQAYFPRDRQHTDLPWFVPFGIFRTVRHPSYLAILAVILGISLAFSSLIGLAVLSLAAILVFLRIRSDEKVLAKMNSREYQNYLHESRWRVLPGLY